ncbi:MAG: hypothetical protein IH969_03410 [Candidatus Krumholzibacteriota bacterium]|nr:hypothetical protein [Candidatus Krumholzibacteriota bacterium]
MDPQHRSLPLLGRLLSATALVAGILAMQGCEGSSPPDPVSSSMSDQSLQWHIQMTSGELVGIGTVGDEMLALARGGAVLRQAGNRWLGDYRLPRVAGDIWIGTDGQAWVVGGGAIRQFDGERWVNHSTSFFSRPAYNAVWANSPEDVFVVGPGEVRTSYDIPYLGVIHYDGEKWEEVGVWRDGSPILNDVWGTASDTVFAVGQAGASYRVGIILGYDGKSWTVLDTPLTSVLYAVCGGGADDVFAVGANGSIVHYDGSEWRIMASPTTENLYDLWRVPNGDLLAVGERGVILQYSGDGWMAVESNTSVKLNAVWGRSETDVYAVGRLGSIHHFDGVEWARVWGGVNSGGSKRYGRGRATMCSRWDDMVASSITTATNGCAWRVARAKGY